jgi:hypothetical protein
MSKSKMPRLKAATTAMKKIDRMDWSVGFSLESYGVRIGIRSNNPDALDRVCQYLPKDWETFSLPVVDRVYSMLIRDTRSRTQRLNHLFRDERRLVRCLDLEDLFGIFESDLRIFVAEYAKQHVFVHAGAVAWKGQAIVIPGRSHSGKSTLVAELIRAGATYYSDEYAVFDSRGRVHPFAKPIELRQEGSYKQKKVDVSELGGHLGTKPLPVGLVVMTHFKNGASWRPRKLTAGKGVLEMLFNTVSARRNPQRALAILQRVAMQADVLKGVRGQANDVASAILKRMEKRLNHNG